MLIRARTNKPALVALAMVPVCLVVFLTYWGWGKEPGLSAWYSWRTFSPEHSLAYPVFLWISDLLSPSHNYVVFSQIWLYAIGVFYLCIGIYRVSANHLLAFLCAFVLCLNPFALADLKNLSGDAFSLIVSIWMLGFILSGVRCAGFLNLFGFGLCLGVVLCTEPYNLIYLPLLLICAPLFVRRNHCSFLKAFLLPGIVCAALLSLEASTYASLNPEREYRPATPSIFARAVLMETEQPSPYAPKDPRTRIWKTIEQDLKLLRNGIWRADFAQRMDSLKGAEEAIAADFELDAMAQAGLLLNKTADQIRMDITSSRIIQDPLAYAKISWSHYRDFWTRTSLIAPVLGVISLLTCLVGLWYWFARTIFNGPFTLALVVAFMLQGQSLVFACTGVGPAMALVVNSPLFALLIVSLLAGFYSAFISPPRTDG